MANVKGLAIIACKNYLLEHFSESDLEKLKKELGDRLHEILMNPLTGTFYPIDDFLKINMAIDKVLGNNDTSILRTLGSFSADEANRGVYKVFFKIGSPQFIIKKAAVVFGKYYDIGKLALIESSSNYVKLELTGFSQYKELTKYLCVRVEGWIERTLKIVSGKEVKTIQEKCVSRGDSSCIFISKW